MYGWSIIVVNFNRDKNKEGDNKDIKNNIA
jgi:hypothetical protein